MADTMTSTVDFLTSKLEAAKEEAEVIRLDVSAMRRDLHALESRQRQTNAMVSALEKALEDLGNASKA
jgi:chromosome segregation ATPase